MKKLFNLNDPVGFIVAEFPGASAIFSNHHVDFCCGGERPLSEAAADGNAEPQALLEELNEAWQAFNLETSQYEDWARATPERLTRHIVETHHAFLRKNMPLIGELMFKVLQVHSLHHPELFKVHRIYGILRRDLEAHLVKEETILFPAIGSGVDTKEIIEELETEHVGAGDALKLLREITDHFTAPADACPSFKELYRLLQAMEQDTFIHVHLENNILFKGQLSK